MTTVDVTDFSDVPENALVMMQSFVEGREFNGTRGD